MPFLRVTMQWSGEQRGFVVETFFKNGESVVATQRAFRRRFGLNPQDSVPDPKTIRKWIVNVRTTGSAIPKKPAGRPKNVRTPENIRAVRRSIEHCVLCGNMLLPLEYRRKTVRRILQTDLKLHPYKLMIAQELSPQDCVTRRDACNAILTGLPPGTIVWTSDEAHFHLCGTSKIFVTGQVKSFVNCTKDPPTALKKNLYIFVYLFSIWSSVID
ncbi:unnamed protein product [Brassicogethes aeneus]|uniref:DUF4817 domain-containing protein n=1 Tax=Brassicogethes aeneus TaxID=1431903 RepID=A0A9P0AWF2_BRAAE|nr:unnamed protein product [Brassicogethes aeneus]